MKVPPGTRFPEQFETGIVFQTLDEFVLDAGIGKRFHHQLGLLRTDQRTIQ